MKKLIFVLFLLVSLIGCQQSKTIKIGVVGSMSGQNSDLAISGRRGIEIFIDEVNKTGGINGQLLELVVKDDLNDSKRAAEIVKEFEAEGVEIVIGHFTSGMMLAAYDNLLKSDLLYLAPTVSADSLNNIDDNLLRFIAPTKDQAIALAQLSKKIDVSNFAIIMDSNNKGFNNALKENFKGEVTNDGGSVLFEEEFETLDDETLDFIINRISEEKENLDVVFIIANAIDLTTIEQRLHLENIDIIIYGSLWAHTTDLLRLGGNTIEDDYFISGIDLDSSSREFLSLEDKYKKRYGENITFTAMYTYETMAAIKYGLEASNSSDWEEVKNAILEKSTFDGLQGTFSLNEFGDNNRLYTVDTIMDGKFKRFYED